MATLKTRIKKVFLITIAAALFIAVFIIDVINWSVTLDAPWLTVARHVCMIGAFTASFLLIDSLWKRDYSPVKKLGFTLVVTLVIGIAALLLSLVFSGSFDAKNYSLIPSGFDALLIANIYGVVFGSTMLLVILILRDVILSKRKRGTRRNFGIAVSLILLTSASTIPYKALEPVLLSSILAGLGIIAMALNSFRLAWIVYLSKREKLFSMAYGFVLFGIFLGLFIATMGETTVGRALLFYSRPLHAAVAAVELFGTIYFGMTFVSTLFHLPTAEAFDRKANEVSSLHNLSRLVTQVFDFNELVDTVTNMTLEVCEAKSSWLEIIRPATRSLTIQRLPSVVERQPEIETVALKNISLEDTRAILIENEGSIRKLVLDARKPVVIDSVKQDRRMQHLVQGNHKFNSMVIVPLLSHDTIIGILYATKDMEFGFDREDVELLSAFADQATIAIENSRLIEKSLERERLLREMKLAQEMQRKLLPQELPMLAQVELDALSTPAFEVGGDYYDFAMLDEHHLGILVGDVSGKGVSAAFYMAEMKGIFQSLGKIYLSPREFLASAHNALMGTIDKRSFISLIYAVLDVRTGVMTIARAGHCPMLYVSASDARYVTPQGMGLGMGTSKFFGETIGEEKVQFRCGDLAVFYTDGLTEAHPRNGEEFGYERLQEIVSQSNSNSALEMRDAIVHAVDQHMNHEPPEDDLTLVVMRWTGKNLN